MNIEEAAQQQVEKARYADRCDQAQTTGYANALGQAARPHPLGLLAMREKRTAQEGEKVKRFRTLLEAHPEFPELLELMRLNQELYIFEY